MPKYIIKEESLITKFLLSIFDAVAGQKKKTLTKIAMADPEMQKIIQQLETSREKIMTRLNKYRQDPKMADTMKMLDDLLGD